jgi:hypothetical protein
VAEDALIRELSAAVERTPDALELRLHLAELLLDDGRYAEALSHCSTALTQDSANSVALTLLQRCSAVLSAPAGENTTFNWSAAEEEVADIIEPAFVDYGGGSPDVENERDLDVRPATSSWPTSPGCKTSRPGWRYHCSGRSGTRN